LEKNSLSLSLSLERKKERKKEEEISSLVTTGLFLPRREGGRGKAEAS
jgi:hypothetical protein